MTVKFKSTLTALVILALLPLTLPSSLACAAESTFGKVAIPDPELPTTAAQCVEPTDVMRRDHMKFLLHQRDATVIDGVRSEKYSLVGCINCHNPSVDNEKVVRYEDPEHFCAGCHLYTGVSIDCFECHADRGLKSVQQSRLDGDLTTKWHSVNRKPEFRQITAATLKHRLEDSPGVD